MSWQPHIVLEVLPTLRAPAAASSVPVLCGKCAPDGFEHPSLHSVLSTAPSRGFQFLSLYRPWPEAISDGACLPTVKCPSLLFHYGRTPSFPQGGMASPQQLERVALTRCLM